jgi:hypothetical protein
MEMLILAFTVILAIVAIVATEFGVDSRGFSDDPHRSPYPVGLS